MTKAAKVTLLAAILVILAFAVGQLRRQGGGFPPAASVTGSPNAEDSLPSSSQRIRQQPTILQPRPASEGNGFQPGPERRNGQLPATVGSGTPERFRPGSRHVPNRPQDPRPSFQNESWPVSRPLGIPSPFQLDRLEAGKIPTEPTPREIGPPMPHAIPSAEFPVVATSPSQNLQPTSVQASEQDSFWNISLRVYGVGDYYKALYFHNRGRVRRPDMIDPGMVILTPTPDELRRLYPDHCPQSESR